MGYELNRIMKQYGVSTPGMAAYSGAPVPTAPTAPTGSRPADDIGDADLTDRQQVYDQQLTNYNHFLADPVGYRMSVGYGGTNPKPFTAPSAPSGDRPGSTSASAGAQAAYDKQLADFNAYTADPNALNEQMRKYNIDKESYDKYKTTYQSRLQNTPMYAQGQFQKDQPQMTFQTGQPLVGNTLTPEIAKSLMQASMMDGSGVPTSEFNRYGGYDKVKALYDAGGGSYAKPTQSSAYTVADLYRMYLGREPEAGIVGSAAASTRPNFINEAQGELSTKPTFGNQNLMNATGSYYGNQLKNPIYAAEGGSVHDLAEKYADGGPVGYGFGGAISRALNSGRDANNNSDYANFMIQQQQAGAPTQFAEPPPDYDRIVQDAYGTLQGRTGIGTEAGNIDQGGLDYWKSQLASGAIKPEDFRGAFSSATDQYMANNPEDKYTKQVQGFMPPHIANLYKEVLGRAPDTGGAAYWAKEFGDEVNADELNTFIQAAQPEMKTRFSSSPFYRGDSSVVSGVTGGGGSTTKDKLEKAAINAALSYAIGPTYDYANAVNSLSKGNIGAAAGNLVSGLSGGVSNIAKKFRFEDGGPVKTHYQTAGAVRLPSGYISPDEEEDTNQRFRAFRETQPEAETNPIGVRSVPMPVTNEMPVVAAAPKAALTNIAINSAKNASEPAPVAVVPAPKAAVPFGNDNLAGIQTLLATYGPKDSAYAADLQTARATAKADSDAFAKMLTSTMSSPEDAQNSKAEIYFRLAAAFGAPTKTGQFSENLGMVGKELGEYAKGKRATAKEKQLLGLEVQKLKMASSKEDLNTLRALSAEEMKDKRAIATELIKEYINSGKPQSTAGKQALDEGLVAGTPAYQKRVAEIGNANVEAKMAQITAALANVQTSAANMATQSAQLALAQNKFENQKAQQAKLTSPELKLKVEAEDLIASSKQSLADLKQAYALNPNSLAGGWLDKGQQWMYEAAGSKDPTIVNTRVLNNLLGSQGLAKLRATFGGSPTEGERSILLELEGIGAKTKDERGQIIKRAYKVLQDRQAREQTRLNLINQGAYRDTAPIEGGN
jgi:hypothetical protein